MRITNLISLGDLAKELKKHKSTLQYYKKLGILKPIAKVGGMHLYEKSEVLAALEKMKKTKVRFNISFKDLAERNK